MPISEAICFWAVAEQGPHNVFQPVPSGRSFSATFLDSVSHHGVGGREGQRTETRYGPRGG